MYVSGINRMSIRLTELWERLGSVDVEDEKDILADERGTLSEQEREYLESGLREAKELEDKENAENEKSSKGKEQKKDISRNTNPNITQHGKDSKNTTSYEKSNQIIEQNKSGKQSTVTKAITYNINNFNKDVNTQENKIVKD